MKKILTLFSAILIISSCSLWDTLTSNKTLLYGNWKVSAFYIKGKLKKDSNTKINATFDKKNTVEFIIENLPANKESISLKGTYTYNEKNNLLDVFVDSGLPSQIKIRANIKDLNKNNLTVHITEFSAGIKYAYMSDLVKDIVIELSKL